MSKKALSLFAMRSWVVMPSSFTGLTGTTPGSTLLTTCVVLVEIESSVDEALDSVGSPGASGMKIFGAIEPRQ